MEKWCSPMAGTRARDQEQFSTVPVLSDLDGVRFRNVGRLHSLILRLFLLLITVCAAESVAADQGYFAQTLFRVMQEAGCPACHNENGVASATRLHFPDSGATPDRV